MASEFDAIAGKVLNVGPIQVKMTKRIWSGRRHLKSNRKVSDGPGPFASGKTLHGIDPCGRRGIAIFVCS